MPSNISWAVSKKPRVQISPGVPWAIGSMVAYLVYTEEMAVRFCHCPSMNIVEVYEKHKIPMWFRESIENPKAMIYHLPIKMKR